MTELVLAQGYTFFQFFVVLFVSWGITTFFYWRTFTTLNHRRFFTLLLLRYIAIAVVVFLLFRPMLQYTKEQVQRKSIVFAVDTSASMGISDGAGVVAAVGDNQADGPVRMQIRVDQAKDKIKAWSEKLEKDFALHLLEFSDKATNLQDVSLAPTLKAEGTSTSLTMALIGALSVTDTENKKISPKEIEALFLFSDGQNNTARNPASDAARLGVPIYSIGVGTGLKSSSSFKDVQVSDIRAPERLTLNNRARITAGIDAVGLEGRTVRVILEEDITFATDPTRGKKTDENQPESELQPNRELQPVVAETGSTAPGSAVTRREIGRKELLLDAIEGAQDVMFEFKPEKVGRTLYIARVEPLGDEAIKENNERQTAALVVEPGMRVFYLEGTLRPEYGAIVERFLSKDPDLEFCAMVQTKPNIFQRRTNIEDFELRGLPTDQETIDSFDVFIIGDIDSSYFRPEVQEMIVKRIQSGAGLIMLGGYHSLGPGGYAGSPIGKVLPVVLGSREVGQFTEPFMPKLTPDGVNSTIFANIGGFFPSTLGAATKEGLPMLTGCTRVLAQNPAATVLATCPQVKVPGPGSSEVEMPVLAVQPVGEGKTAVFTGDTTRRWQQGPRAMNQDTPFMQFWGQLVRYIGGREGAVLREAGVSASVDKAYYEPEESVTITTTVKNEDGQGSEKASVSAVVIRPDGKEDNVKLEPVDGTPGRYIGTYEPKTIGQQEVKVSAKLEGLVLQAPEKMIIDVGRPNMEFDRLDLNEELMTRIADASGGRYSHITTADFLVDQLNRDLMKKKVIEQVRLAPPLFFWMIFVFLLTVEWALRRRYHLR